MTIHKTSKAEESAYLPCLSNDDIHLNTGTWGFKASFCLVQSRILGSAISCVPSECLTTGLWVTSSATKIHMSYEKKEKNWWYFELKYSNSLKQRFQILVWFVSFQVRQFQSLLSLKLIPYKAFTFLSRMSLLISTNGLLIYGINRDSSQLTPDPYNGQNIFEFNPPEITFMESFI